MIDTVAHVYRGLSRTDIESTVALVHRGAIALAALTVLAVNATLLALATALAVPSLLAFVVSRLVVRRVAGDGLAFHIDPPAFRSQVAPLGLGVLIAALYFRIDVFFLQRWHGVEVVGQYNAAFRIVDALRLFAAAGLAVAYPALCAASSLRPVQRLSAALVAGSIAVAVPVFLAAAPMLGFVYGPAFVVAGPTLQTLSLSLPFFFLNYALTHQVIAWDRQYSYLRIASAALLTNVATNAWLIPRYQMIGAAYSTLLTEIAVCVGCIIALRRR
jgi:O-antigen/teichoic acid export membrane protein